MISWLVKVKANCIVAYERPLTGLSLRSPIGSHPPSERVIRIAGFVVSALPLKAARAKEVPIRRYCSSVAVLGSCSRSHRWKRGKGAVQAEFFFPLLHGLFLSVLGFSTYWCIAGKSWA